MNDALAQLEDAALRSLKRKASPGFVQPMKATLVHDAFSDPDWLFERKLDGERCLIHKNGRNVELFSRNQKNKNKTYPEIFEAIRRIDGDFLADSEIVTFEGSTTSFKRLQKRIHEKDPDTSLIKEVPVYAYLFDIIYLDGYDLEHLPLRTRKKVLHQALRWKDPIRYLPHRNECGRAFFSTACAKGWEGLIAKAYASTYVHSRSKSWLKFKCDQRQELIIAGYTAPKGQREGFGALLLGYYNDEAELLYAGCVGTGYDDAFLKDFHDKLQKIERKTSPFADYDSNGDVHWVQPKYVGEVGFTEWTAKNRLRHPRFLGLRDDKAPEAVSKESSS